MTTSGRSRPRPPRAAIEVTADGGDLEIGLRLEQTPDALADEVVILGEDEANRHRQKNTAAADGNAARGSAAGGRPC